MPHTSNSSNHNGFFRTAFRILELAVILIALITFLIEFGYHKHEERKARSWQLLTTKAPGNSGKIEALEYLNRQKVPDWLTWLPFTKRRVSLEGIQLLPPILAEWGELTPEERQLEARCTQYTYLREVKLSEAVLIDATLACADLQDANIQDANLQWADMKGSDLEGANLEGADLEVGRFTVG